MELSGSHFALRFPTATCQKKEDVMRNWTLIVLAVLALPSFAVIKGGSESVDSLTIAGHSYGRGPWSPCSPTIRSQDGYLAYDPSGKSTAVTFRKVKGAGTGTYWSFAETTSFE